MQTEITKGMATPAQVQRIKELTESPNFKLPLASFLKDITDGRASSIDELTSAQANDVISVFKKLVKK